MAAEPEPEAVADAGGGDPARSVRPGFSSLVSEAAGGGGQLRYAAYTERGDTIPDFSSCGFGGDGRRPLPAGLRSLVCEALEPVPDEEDCTSRVQAALDRAADLPLGADGPLCALST